MRMRLFYDYEPNPLASSNYEKIYALKKLSNYGINEDHLSKFQKPYGHGPLRQLNS